MSKPDLAACPFCGGEAKRAYHNDMVMCNCNRAEMTRVAWNRRSFCPDHEFCCNTCNNKCGIEIVEGEPNES